MKGTLTKTEQGWMVKHSRLNDDGEQIGFGRYEQLPLHPEDAFIQEIIGWDGKEVKFEVFQDVSDKGGDNLLVNTYAKIIYKPFPKKDHIVDTNEMIDHVPDVGNKVGDDEDLYRQADKLLDPDWSDGDQFNRNEVLNTMVAFAKMVMQKENTYTLKEMRMSFLAGQDYQGRFENNLSKGKSFGDFISSLKQPKKD